MEYPGTSEPTSEPAADVTTREVTPSTTAETRSDRLRRQGRQVGLYAWVGALVVLLVLLIAFVLANTRSVQLSWVFGSTRASLVWIIVGSAIVGWLLGIVTSILIRASTRRRS